MTRRDLLLLFLLGLAVPLAIAQFQSLPGYMDADYYFGGGIQLARGNGFTEPYLWNYLAGPQGLPTPSHAYWMPLASIISAIGMWLTRQANFASARLGFILLAALVPPLTALLAFRLTSSRALSLLSGLLACFPIYYAPFLPVTDNYAIYMVLGISFFLLLSSLIESTTADQLPFTNYRSLITFFLLGIISALMTLARSDGLLWLGLSLLVALWYAGKQVDRYTGTQGNRETGTQVDKYTSTQVDTYISTQVDTYTSTQVDTNTGTQVDTYTGTQVDTNTGTQVDTYTGTQVDTNTSQPATPNLHHAIRNTQHATRNIVFILLGYLLLLSPWYARNLSVFGSLMAPGGSRVLWLTNYDDTFAYPASQLTMQRWLASGWDAILTARFSAMRFNLLNAFAAQGGIFLFPFILIGLWQLRKDARIRFAALAWILLLAAMTIVFPFAGERGAFFHAGAALQPVWWALAPIGLDAVIASARRRGWFDERAFVVFRGALVGIAVLVTAFLFVLRVLPGWEREDGIYVGLKELLAQAGAPSDAIVIVRNPPGFYLITDYRAITLPNGDLDTILEVARRYNARYLVAEPTRVTGVLSDYRLNQAPFRYLGESNGNRLYEILR